MCEDEEDDALSWLQLTLEAGEHTVGQLEDALLEAGAVAVTLSDAVDEPVLEPAPGETPLWRRTLVTGLFDSDTDVETAKHLVCAALGCDELQGYLFAKPMSATALSLWAMDDPDGKPGRAADQGFRSSLFNETQHAAL